MPSEHTTNYSLSQWAKDDQVRMEDFNADNAKIDAAIKSVAQTMAGKLDKTQALRVITGSYTGTGTQDTIHYTIGARPKLLILVTNNILINNNYNCFFFSIEGITLNFHTGGSHRPYFDGRVTFDDTGFSVDHSKTMGEYNVTGKTQFYWALC